MNPWGVIGWCCAILAALFTAGCLGFAGILIWILFSGGPNKSGDTKGSVR